jgi:dienelactone hydrolase
MDWHVPRVWWAFSASCVSAVAQVCGQTSHGDTSAPQAERAAPADELPGSDPELFAEFRRADVSRPFLDVASSWQDAPRGSVMKLTFVQRALAPVWFKESDIRDVQYPVLEAERTSCISQLGEAGLASVNDLEHATLSRPGVCLVLATGESKGRAKSSVPEVFRHVAVHRTASGELELETTCFQLLRADAAKHPAPRGIVLLMPGLLGTPEGTLSMLTSRLRAGGWHVLRMMAQPSRFTQSTAIELDPSDPQGAARRIVAEIGPRTVACAESTRAVFAVLAQDPELAALPRVAIGFSAGAMTLPTVVAREPGAYAAAILVGGGSNYWLMTQTSNYSGWISAVRPAWTREPSVAERHAIDDAYLDVAAFDSFHTAAALQQTRTLMIHGNADMAVPSPLGDALWERARKPERWIYPLGHELLFAQLPGLFPRIMAWLDEAVPRPVPGNASSTKSVGAGAGIGAAAGGEGGGGKP